MCVSVVLLFAVIAAARGVLLLPAVDSSQRILLGLGQSEVLAVVLAAA